MKLTHDIIINTQQQVTDVLPPPHADFDDVYMVRPPTPSHTHTHSHLSINTNTLIHEQTNKQVGELMDVDLHRAIYYGRPLSQEHIQFFLYQLLCGIKYIHSVGIVHRCARPGTNDRSRPPS